MAPVKRIESRANFTAAHLVREAAGGVEMHEGGVSARARDAAVVPMFHAVHDL